MGRWLGALVLSGTTLATTPATGASSCDVWTGAVSSNWALAGNWSAGVPGRHRPACIPAGRSVQVAARAVAASVRIGRRAQLTVGPGATLEAAGAVTVAGTLELSGDSGTIRAPLVAVGGEGTLEGIGTVTGNLDNGGSVLLLDGGTGVPMRVGGTYAQAPAASILARFEGGSFERMVAGRASLAGTLHLLLMDAVGPGTSYTILTSPSLSGRWRPAPGYVLHYTGGRARAVVTPQIQLAPPAARPGATVAVSGYSFGYGGAVSFHLDRASGPSLGSVTTTDVGIFQGSARLPATVPAGRHILLAVSSLGVHAWAPLTVRR